MTVDTDNPNYKLNCKPCEETTSYCYHDNGKHIVVATCSMCKNEQLIRTENCTIQNNVCTKCQHIKDTKEARNIKIKIRTQIHSEEVVYLPEYSTIKEVPEGLKIIGYWYVDSEGSISEAKQGDEIEDGVDTYYAICTIEKRILNLNGLLNYLTYAIINAFRQAIYNK